MNINTQKHLCQVKYWPIEGIIDSETKNFEGKFLGKRSFFQINNYMAAQGLTRYRDLDLSFIKHPVTKDLAMKFGDQAVIQSLKNLVFTSFYERPFHPEIGSGIRQLLFENVDSISAQRIKSAIITVINNFEPRVTLREVIVQSSPDRNSFEVKIDFFIVSNQSPNKIQFFLERIL